MNRWRVVTFRTDDVTYKRLKELTSEDVTLSKATERLVKDALNDRECHEQIRRAEPNARRSYGYERGER